MKRHIIINKKYEQHPLLCSLLSSIEVDSCYEEEIYSNRRNIIWLHHIENLGKIAIKIFRYDAFKQLIYKYTDKSKAKRAYNNALVLLNNGINTPEPLAYIDVIDGAKILFSVYVTLYTTDKGITSLIEESKECAIELARMTAKMHVAGIVHHDMNSSNILYNKQGEQINLSLIDLNRMMHKSSLSFKEEMDDLVRFTGNLETFINVIYPYATFMNYDIEPFVRKATIYKIKHDANWERKKKIKKLFK